MVIEMSIVDHNTAIAVFFLFFVLHRIFQFHSYVLIDDFPVLIILSDMSCAQAATSDILHFRFM